MFKDTGAGIKFEFDWISSNGVAGPELSATWAALYIHVGESTITRVLDQRSKTIRDMVFVPLYPLAEWLVSNWWFLLYEFENPVKENDRAFDRRHSLRFGREGYGYPDLQIVSSGHLVRLVWNRDQPSWFRHECVEQGWTLIDRESWYASCADLIDCVIARLHEFDIHDTLLEQDWSAVQQADEEEFEFCKTAAGLGLDPYAMEDDSLKSVLRLGETLKGVALEEAAAALSPEDIDTGITDVQHAVENAKRNHLGLERLAPVVYRASDFRMVIFAGQSGSETVVVDAREASLWKTSNPWREGCALAREFREALELDNDPLPTWCAIAHALGEPVEQLELATRPVSFGSAILMEGVITRNRDENIGFALSGERDESRRFLFCRALADILTSPDTDTVLTRARSWRQQLGRAFAAEFLAPAPAIRKRISTDVILEDDIGPLAREFGVSPFVIRHQIDNHEIARVWSDARSQW